MTQNENLPAVIGATEIDDEAVQEAVSQIKFILNENFGNASYQVVDYLFRNFFGSNTDNLKKRKLDDHKSFQNLLIALQDETGRSKAWLYEAIKLWQDREYFKKLDEETNDQYLQLSISHRALLLKVSDPEKKKGFAQEFFVNKVTYKDAKEMLRGHSPDTEYSKLNRLITHFEELDEEEFKETTGKRNLKSLFEKLEEPQMVKVAEKANARVGAIEAEIKEKQNLLNRARSIKKQLDAVSEEVKKANNSLTQAV